MEKSGRTQSDNVECFKSRVIDLAKQFNMEHHATVDAYDDILVMSFKKFLEIKK